MILALHLKSPGTLLHYGLAYTQAPGSIGLGQAIGSATLDMVRESDASMSVEGWEYAPIKDGPDRPPTLTSH